MPSNEMCHQVTYVTDSVAAEINDIDITGLTGLSQLWVPYRVNFSSWRRVR